MLPFNFAPSEPKSWLRHWAEGCWERKFRKAEGKRFMLTVMRTLKLEMKGGGKPPNNGVPLSFPCFFVG